MTDLASIVAVRRCNTTCATLCDTSITDDQYVGSYHSGPCGVLKCRNPAARRRECPRISAPLIVLIRLAQILAALDVHTSRHIVDKCLKGDILRGRTIVLVVSSAPVNLHGCLLTPIIYRQTHNVAMVSPVADFVVDMGSDGRILSQGSLSSALSRDSKLLKEIQEEQKELDKAEQEIDKVDDTEKVDVAKQISGKLVVAEEVEEGHVGWKASEWPHHFCAALLEIALI